MVHAWGNFGQPLGELRSTLGGIPGFRIQTSATHARGLPQTQATNPRRPHVKRKNTRLCSGSLRVVHGMRRWINSAGTCDQRYLCFLRGNRSGFSPKCNQFPATLPAAAMDLTILPACTAPPPNSSQSAKGGVDGLLPINMSSRCLNATVAEQRMELELLFCPAPPQQQHIQMYIIISWGVLPGGVLPNTNTGKKAHNVQKT